MKELDLLVTQEHIDSGCTDSRHCPIALAMNEATGLHTRVTSGTDGIMLFDIDTPRKHVPKSSLHQYGVHSSLRMWILDFDDDEPVKPIRIKTRITRNVMGHDFVMAYIHKED